MIDLTGTSDPRCIPALVLASIMAMGLASARRFATGWGRLHLPPGRDHPVRSPDREEAYARRFRQYARNTRSR